MSFFSSNATTDVQRLHLGDQEANSEHFRTKSERNPIRTKFKPNPNNIRTFPNNILAKSEHFRALWSPQCSPRCFYRSKLVVSLVAAWAPCPSISCDFSAEMILIEWLRWTQVHEFAFESSQCVWLQTFCLCYIARDILWVRQ